MPKRTRTTDIDVLGLGIIPLDILLEIESFPDLGGKTDARSMALQGGGPVPNCLVGLRRLGLSAAVIAPVGDDLTAKYIHEELASESVQDLLVRRKGQSDLAAGYVEQGSGRRTIVLNRGVNVRPADLRLNHLPRPRLIHLDGRDLEACLKLARWGKKVGAIVSFDIGSMRNDVTPLIKLVDHLVVADAFALPYTGSRTARAALTKLAKICPGAIVITEGIRGQIGLENGALYRETAYKITPVDTTGAGDAFHTGYLYALLQGKPMPERLRLGSIVATLNCLKLGARAGLPTHRRIRDFIQAETPHYA